MNIDFFKNYNPYTNKLKSVKLASVLIPIVYVDGEEHILFQTRSTDLKAQPGEVSLPGGKMESGETPKQSAVRETCEELGVAESDIEIIGQSDFFVSPIGAILHPFVGRLNYYEKYNYNKDEVKDVFMVPLKFFKENEPETYRNSSQVSPSPDFPFEYIEKYMPNSENFKFLKREYEVYFYVYENRLIWGMTAAIIKNFIELMNTNDK